MPPVHEERIYNQLDAIQEAVNDLGKKFAAFDTKCTNCDTRLKGLEATTYGNGSPGLKTLVDRNRAIIKAGYLAICAAGSVVLVLVGALAAWWLGVRL